MKLKHLFLSTLVACAFASCSDDDGPGEPVYQQIDSYLSIAATPDNKTITKGGAAVPGDPEQEAGASNEQTIESIRAVVFYCDAEGNPSELATIKKIDDPTVKADGSIEITDIKIKIAAQAAGDISTTVLKMFLLANIEVADNVTDYATFSTSYFEGIDKYDFNKVMKNNAANTEPTGKAYLPMSSTGLLVKGLVAGTDYNNWVEASDRVVKTVKNNDGTENKMGTNDKYTNAARIPLTRYVARVQLESLTADFGGNYENATFTLTQVSLANVSNASNYIENNSSLQHVEMNGDNYSREAFYRGFPENIERADYYLARGKYDKGVFSKIYGTINGKEVEDGIKFGVGGEKFVTFKDATDPENENKNEMAQFYVFEFQNIPMTADLPTESDVTLTPNDINTMLILTGLWDNGYIKEERSFRIPIRHSSEPNDYQVKRNYIYKVHATLTGEGTSNPDKNMLNAFVSFTIDVDKWLVIKQTETDVN